VRKKRIQPSLPPPLLRRAEQYCDKEGLRLSEILAQALGEFLDRKEQKEVRS